MKKLHELLRHKMYKKDLEDWRYTVSMWYVGCFANGLLFTVPVCHWEEPRLACFHILESELNIPITLWYK